MSAAGWDAAMSHELRRVYFEAMRDALVGLNGGGSMLAAHDEGLRAVARHAVAIERDADRAEF